MNSGNVTSLGENLMQAIVFFSMPLVQTVSIALLAAALSAFLFIQLRERSRTERNEEPATLTGLRVLAVLLAPIWLLIVGYVLRSLGALAMDFDATLNNTKDGTELRWHVLGFVGLITALGALVSAPLALIRVWTTERQTRTSEQGHMTDRISKAVEQLGAEKDISRPMRNVTFIFKDNDGEEIKGETVLLGKDDPLPPLRAGGRFCYGDWQINKRTVPNIEVRIGGLLSLERIAQDSTRYDRGRDHVRVMEILCAYVRENAKAEDAEISWRERWEEASEGAADTPPMSKQEFLEHVVGDPAGRLENYIGIPATKQWANCRPSPRADIQLAMTIIGRRSTAQKDIEARWPDEESSKTAWVFAPEAQARGATMTHLTNYKGYRLDLRNANFQKMDFKGLDFSGAKLDDCRLDGADLRSGRFVGCLLSSSKLIGVDLSGADISLSWLMVTRLEACILERTGLQGVQMVLPKFEGAAIKDCELDGETKWYFEVRNMFGDASVKMPSRVPAPAHWPKWNMEWRGFSQQWREWQDDPEGYTPPDPPASVPG